MKENSPMSDLSELAERIEAAGQDEQSEMLSAAWDALRLDLVWMPAVTARFSNLLTVGAYESAARMLTPSFDHLVSTKELWNGPGTENGKSFLVVIHRYGRNMWTGNFSGLAETEALAFAAARLRAQAAIEEAN